MYLPPYEKIFLRSDRTKLRGLKNLFLLVPCSGTITFTTCQAAFWKYNILKTVHQMKTQSWLLQKLCPSVLIAEEQSILSIFTSIYAVSSNWFLDWFIDMISKKLEGCCRDTLTCINYNVTSWVCIIFSPYCLLSRGSSSGHLVPLWNVSAVTVWVKRDKEWGGKEQTGKTSSNKVC